MSLTGKPFFAFTIGLVVVLTVVMVLVWNRVPGARPIRVASRVVLAVLGQAAAVLAVLVYVNNTYGLYDSWSDLLGSGNGQVRLAAGGDLGGAPAGRARHARHRHILRFTHFKPDVLVATATGPRSHVTGQLYVWLPPQYHQAAYRNTVFPVVELLPGYPGSPQAWFGAMGVQQEMSDLMRTGRVRPMVLVAAKMNVLGNKDPGCADVPHVSKTATWLGRDVPSLVKDNFRVASEARHWAVMGYSAGAYCAVNLALHYPHILHSAVSLSGYNAPISQLVTADPALARANNPYLELRDARRQPDVALLMAGSEQDGDTVYAANALLAVQRDRSNSRLLTVSRGGHNTRVWEAMLPTALVWISQQIG